MNTPILIAFGANIDPERNLALGVARLHAICGVSAISTVYRTKAVAGSDAPPDLHLPDFLNGALRIQGDWHPATLRARLKSIEQELGRQPRQPGWAPRPLDLDIALMGSLQLHTPELTIPDPDIPERAFLTLPLAELAPNLIHPTLRLSLRTLAQRFPPDPEAFHPDPAATARLRAIIPL
ncbi:MAG: 2-amino-4-hydroxy-6-hydroxymethyldihydropteridine diphosphokinase [Magnetococcales bacterium]|nr:2-amino-4-hydroxy-6-hydroxymethyldihydropteridine diphosphokinase [Magnetococcales bacterium]